MAAEVDTHLQSCAACAAEFEAAGDTWQRLALIPGPRPDSTAMRARFDAALEDYQQERSDRPRWSPVARYALQALAAAALIVIGVAIGRSTVPAPAPDPQISEMRTELREMRHMVTLSLLQQGSASDRLKGVTFTGQLDQPGTDIAAALLEALRYDANVNVRLATIDALKRFAGDEAVRRGTVETLPEQTPIVQIALIDFLVETDRRDAAAMLRRLSTDAMVDAAVRARAEQGLLRLG
ncbi:MAG: HEAT repeat domain-containing protein [Microvirga sp.]